MPSISVDFGETTGYVTPRLYGAGFEHVGANVYGGFWVGNGDGATEGWRDDVLSKVRALRPGLLRWPGGNFAQHYNWRDGIGPRAERPQRFDYFWAKPESNHVGTDEFLRLCELVGAEASITVNTRTGTPAQAADWVAYCAGRVKLWALGSQSWELGPEDAARRHIAFAQAMRDADPSITLIGIGGNAVNQSTWDRAFLSSTMNEVDVLGGWAYDGVQTTSSGEQRDLHYANQASAERLLWAISNASALVDELMPARTNVGVGLDSWGIWRTSRQGLQHDYHLGDGLVAAVVLHGLHRLARRARYAAWGNLVNALGLIQATQRNCWTTPVGEVFKLLRQHHGDEVVRSTVAGEAFYAPQGEAPVRSTRSAWTDVPYLDASATRDRASGRYCLSIVNRHFDDRIEIDLTTAGIPQGVGATVHTMSDYDAFATNNATFPRRCEPYAITVGTVGSTYYLSARSVTVFVWEETPGLGPLPATDPPIEIASATDPAVAIHPISIATDDASTTPPAAADASAPTEPVAPPVPGESSAHAEPRKPSEPTDPANPPAPAASFAPTDPPAPIEPPGRPEPPRR